MVSPSPYARERHIAQLAVLRASILTKQVQCTVGEISKEDDSPVTIADFAAQALIIKALQDAFPEDSFLGEESAAALRRNETLRDKVYELASSTRTTQCTNLPALVSKEEMLDLIDLGGCGKGCEKVRFWVLDPVDGTAAFLKGQQYAVSLALIDGGKEVVGVLGCPNIGAGMALVSENNIDNGMGIMLTAVRGQGSTVQTMAANGLGTATLLDNLEPSRPENLHIVDCAAENTSRHDIIAELASRFGAKFPNTDICSCHIRYASLIVGGGDAHFHIPASPTFEMPVWDHAGSQLIFTELGGRITDLEGKEIDFCAGRGLRRNRGLVVAKSGIHGRVLKELRDILKLQ